MNRRDVLIGVVVASALCIPSSVVFGDGFTDPSNWVTYDFPDDNSTDGFGGAAYAEVEGCIYFAPWIGSATITRYCNNGAFDEATSWASCDVGSLIGALGGYNGVAFDGRYVYFAPYSNASGSYHGEVLRHDTTVPFCETGSWATFDAQANAGQISGADRPGGFAGAMFADGYVYFSPSRRYDNGLPNGTANGEVLRYDTSCSFSDPACWQAFDYSKSPVCVNDSECHALGYTEPCFDGQYVYFSPGARDGVFHGEVMRYDSLGGFLDEASWTTYDYGEHCTPGVNCTDPDGYTGCAVDGAGIVYFAQENNHELERGEILRYDSSQPFADPGSWLTYDTSNNQPNSKGGYEGLVYDGFRYVYFVPNSASPSWDSVHAEVLRLDTHAPFTEADAWSIYDYGEDPNGCALQSGCSDPDGYHNAVFDGRFVYFSPSYNGTTLHGEVLRYDTHGRGDCLLYDDFSGDLSQWNLWNGGGTYTITIDESNGVPPPAVLIDDHLGYGAAIFSRQHFTYSEGLMISADQMSDAAWQDQRYTIMGLWRGGSDTSLTQGLAQLSINDNGDTIDCRIVYDACGAEETEYYQHPYANTGQWLYGRINIRADGHVEFYVGPDSATDPDHKELQHICTSTHPVTMDYDGLATVKLGNRRNLYDNVCVRSPAPSKRGPVAYWSFNDPSNPGRDDSGGGHDGTLTGASWTEGALWFDGIDDQMTVPSAPDLELADAISVAAWVHPTALPPASSFGTHSHILSKSNNDYYGGGRNYELDYTRDPDNPNHGWFVFTGGTVGSAYTTGSYATSNWYHVAGVYDPVRQENRIYVNGELSFTRSTVGQPPVVPNDAPLVLGYGEEAAHFFHFEGGIDEVYVYDRVLSPEEIARLAAGKVNDCNENGVPDECDIADCDGSAWCGDCNGNGRPDQCDIASTDSDEACGTCEGKANDCNVNGIPDECESDCDSDGLLDECDQDADNDGIINSHDVCACTPIGATVDATGRPIGDLDQDCDTDLVDYSLFQTGFTGANELERDTTGQNESRGEPRSTRSIHQSQVSNASKVREAAGQMR